MAAKASGTQGVKGAVCCLLAVGLAAVAWAIPARWRSIHPAVLDAAGRGPAQMLDLASLMVRQQRFGPAKLMIEAATKAGVPGSRELATNLAGLNATRPEIRALGGPDAAVAAMLPELGAMGTAGPTSIRTAAEIFLPADHRAAVRRQMAESRSPGAQNLLKIFDLPTHKFVPVNQAGGQALEAVGLLAATLYERERFSSTLAQELRELVELAAVQETSRDRLEDALLGLLSIARRLDWTSLSELTRRTADLTSLDQFARTARQQPDDLALLYAGSVLSGEVGRTARYLADNGEAGRAGLTQALRAGAVLWLVRDGRPVRPGVVAPPSFARGVSRAPREFALGRVGLFFAAASLLGLGLTLFGTVKSEDAGVRSGLNWLPGTIVAGLVGGLLVMASEPLPVRRTTTPKYQWHPEVGALTKPSSVAKPSGKRTQIMGPSTLLTIGIFAALQVAVYVICLRKISELMRLPDPPLVRLRLLENEENLFDVGLYLGIGGTAAALVLQVLQLVEANLLAAYSSNLMGIIGVALVKIGHVRSAKRKLIMLSQDAVPAIVTLPEISAAPAAVDPARVNPFAVR